MFTDDLDEAVYQAGLRSKKQAEQTKVNEPVRWYCARNGFGPDTIKIEPVYIVKYTNNTVTFRLYGDRTQRVARIGPLRAYFPTFKQAREWLFGKTNDVVTACQQNLDRALALQGHVVRMEDPAFDSRRPQSQIATSQQLEKQ